LRGCTIYTSCEPCPMCLAALHWARVDRIVYAAGQQDAAAAGFDDAELYAEVGRPHAERSTPIMQELAEEGTEPFDAWERHEARVPY
ncbi:MAG: nucleoside deaminase, partial [Methylobacterium sp.]